MLLWPSFNLGLRGTESLTFRVGVCLTSEKKSNSLVLALSAHIRTEGLSGMKCYRVLWLPVPTERRPIGTRLRSFPKARNDLSKPELSLRTGFGENRFLLKNLYQPFRGCESPSGVFVSSEFSEERSEKESFLSDSDMLATSHPRRFNPTRSSRNCGTSVPKRVSDF